jgi:hypothetical protein
MRAAEPAIPIENMSPKQAAEYLVDCAYCNSLHGLEAMSRVAEAHKDERFVLEMCEELEQAKRGPDPISAELRRWRERFNSAACGEAP